MNLVPHHELEENDYHKETPFISLEESHSYYILALDLPVLPASQLEIKQKPHLLKVEGVYTNGDDVNKVTLLKVRTQAREPKAVYRDGALWLMLPKVFVNETEKTS